MNYNVSDFLKYTALAIINIDIHLCNDSAQRSYIAIHCGVSAHAPHRVENIAPQLHLIWSLSTKTTILQQLKTVDTAVMQVDVQRICFHEIAMNDA